MVTHAFVVHYRLLYIYCCADFNEQYSGWFWSGSMAVIPPTNQTAKGWKQNPWSHTGKFCIQGLPNSLADQLRWEFIKENKKTRFRSTKRSRKKENTLSTKKAIKKKR